MHTLDIYQTNKELFEERNIHHISPHCRVLERVWEEDFIFFFSNKSGSLVCISAIVKHHTRTEGNRWRIQPTEEKFRPHWGEEDFGSRIGARKAEVYPLR